MLLQKDQLHFPSSASSDYRHGIFPHWETWLVSNTSCSQFILHSKLWFLPMDSWIVSNYLSHTHSQVCPVQFDFLHFHLSALLFTFLTLIPITFSLLKINLLFTYIENRVFSHIIYLDYSSFPLLILSWSTPFMSKTKIITLKKDKAKQERKECKRWYENQRPICSHSGVP